MKKLEQLNYVIAGLMKRYKERVPYVNKTLDALCEKNVISSPNDIINDHIAFRTMGVPLLGIQSLERIFLHYGYEKKDSFFFEQKKLKAFWYAPPTDYYPRIFISELCVELLSDPVQKIINSYIKEVKEDPTLNLDLDDANAVDLFLHGSLWRLPSYEDYQKLLSKSEYAAWVIYNRYYLNHYTISIHELSQGYHVLDKFNKLMESIGVKLNSAGGVIKESADKLLLQSSTVAQKVKASFTRERKEYIAGSYVEFAERRVLPEYRDLPKEKIERKHRRDGFEVGNADKIFESTYLEQVNKSSN